MSASVKPPEPPDGMLDLGALTPPICLENCSYFLSPPPGAAFFYGPSLRTILTPPPAAGAS